MLSCYVLALEARVAAGGLLLLAGKELLLGLRLVEPDAFCPLSTPGALPGHFVSKAA